MNYIHNTNDDIVKFEKIKKRKQREIKEIRKKTKRHIINPFKE